MAVRGSNDFFLQFGSNAPEFAKDLGAQLGPGIEQIDRLRQALYEYDQVAEEVGNKGRKPIGLNFEGLNQAASRIEEATTGFARKFGTQLTELTSRINGLADTLASVGRFPQATSSGRPLENRPTETRPVVPGQVLPPAVVEQRPVAQPSPTPSEPQRPPRHDLIPLPVEPGTPGSRFQRPVPTDIPAILDNKDYPAMPRHQDQEVRRDYYTKLNRFYDNNPGARDADIAYSEAMDEFNAQNKLFEGRKKSWKQKVEQIRKENARLEALNAQLDADAAASAPAEPTPATTPKATATPPAPAATKVTEEDLKETEAARAAARKNADAVGLVAKENEAIANSARVLAETLAALNARLQETSHQPTGGDKVTDATAQVGNEVQVLNSTSNPVPVLVVGAEEAAGHPKGKGHETGKATTATQQAADTEALGEAAAVARTPDDVQNELTAARRAADNAQHRTRRAIANPNRQDEVEGLAASQLAAEAHRDALARELAAARTPPPPPPPASGSNSEPEEKTARTKKPVSLLGGANSSMDLDIAPDVKTIFDKLKQETKEGILASRDALNNPALSDAERQEAIVSAGAHYVEDPAVKALRTAPLKARNFAGMLGLNADDSGVRRVMMETLNQHGPARNRAAANANGVSESSDSQAAAVNAERLVRIQAIMAETTGRVQEALLGQERALAAANAMLVSGETDANKLSAAYDRLARSSRLVSTAVAAEDKAAQPAKERGLYARITNQPAGTTLAGALQRHGGRALENTIGYTLVFTGFEKLKELVHGGIEAQAVFVRLQAELVATGRSAAGVKDALISISHDTASPIEHVIEAASELAGVFHSTKGLEFATNIAAQLANISQGTLSAKEAAIGLRDVTAAYGLQAPKDIQAVGDNIARLSQVTGVSVKDITEGTTQLAQEAHDFGLNQRQTSTLAAYITQGTGEPGEQAAEQASRLLSTLYNSRIQNTLIRNGVTTASKFQEGDIAGVLEDLVKKYRDLNPATRQELASQIGSGRQARAFAALTNGGDNFVQEFTGGSANADKGALARQNTAYLATIAGQMRQFKEDFDNLGVALQRAGVFDLLGVFAKVLDAVARSFTFLLNTFADALDLSPLTREIGHLTIMILELAAASKLLGALTGGWVTLGAGARVLGNVARRVTGREAVAAASDAAKGGAAAAGTGELSAFDTALLESTRVLEAFAVRLLQATDAATANTVATSEEAAAKQADTVASTEDAAAKQADAVATTEDAAAKQADSVATTENAGAQLLGGRGGAAAGGAGLLGRLFRRGGGGAAGEEGAVGASGLLARLGTLAIENPLISVPVLAAAAVLPGAISGKEASDANKTDRNQLFKIVGNAKATSNDDLQRAYASSDQANRRHQSDYSYVAQGIGNGIIGLGGLFHPFGESLGSSTPSPQSQRDELNLSDALHAKLSRAVASKNIDRITQVEDEISKEIAKQGKKLAKEGSNSPAAEANIAVELEAVRVGIANQGDAAILKLKAIQGVHVELNAAQADLLGTYTDAVGNLTPQTRAAFPLALSALQGNAGAPVGTPVYEASLRLAGLHTVAPDASQQKQYGIDEVEYQKKLTTYRAEMEKYLAGTGYGNQGPPPTGTPTRAGAGGLGGSRRPQYYEVKDIDQSKLTAEQRGYVRDYNDGKINFLPAGIPLRDGKTTLTPEEVAQKQTHLGRDKKNVLGTAPQAPVAPTLPSTTASYVESPVQQQKDLLAIYKAQSETYQDVILGRDPDHPGRTKNFSAEQKADAQTKLNAVLGKAQQAQASVFQLPIQQDAAQAQALTATGNYTGAATALTAQKTGLQAYLGTLKKSQPEYWQTLEQIHQVQMQIATTVNTPEMQRLALVAANSLNPLAAARAAHQQALLGVQAAEKAYETDVQDARDLIAADEKALDDYLAQWDGHARGSDLSNIKGLEAKRAKDKKALDALLGTGGKTPERNAAETNAASTAASQAQAAEAVNAAQAAARQAGIRNDVQKGRAQLAEALRLEAVYSGRGDKAGYFNSVAQAEQAQIAIRDAVEQQRESAINAAAALATRHGDAVGAARLGLKAAQDAYAYAVNQYGKNSQEAMQALTTLYQAQQTNINAELDRQNAGIDLQIAQLNARGHLGDDVTAAKDMVKKAENALHSYLSHGGKKGTADYDKLQGDLVSARRAAFDTALQAQLDTLDFQRETYKITSSQEVQSLQQILKNKQLTLKEQRDITLKIKDLQQSIREQLTNGGLNIPSDIKLPTAYEVRRSLGAGFGGQGAVSNTVNNNQQIQINNNVPTAAIATQVANQVITLINQQTGQQLRANSSTPRLVPTR